MLLKGYKDGSQKMVSKLQDLGNKERFKWMDLLSLRYMRSRGDMSDTYKYTHLEYCKTPIMHVLEIFALFASSKKTRKLQAYEKWDVSYVYQSI